MPKVELKQPIIDEIKDLLDGAQSAVIVDYLGLTVEQDTKLRKELRENGVSYKVFKNTLIKRAAEGTAFAELDKHLEGPTALAVSKTDATAPARILAKYAKDIQSFSLKAGIVEGTYYDENGIQVIASIPSRDELLGKLLGSIQSPIANFARVLNQIAEKGGAGSAEEAAPAAEEAPAAEAAPPGWAGWTGCFRPAPGCCGGAGRPAGGFGRCCGPQQSARRSSCPAGDRIGLPGPTPAWPPPTDSPPGRGGPSR